MSRTTLPARRPNTTRRLIHREQEVYVTYGLDPAHGRVMEVFGTTKKPTTDLDYMMTDACILVSMALQYGVTPERLLHSMCFIPVIGSAEKVEEPASLIGKIVRSIIVLEKIISGELEENAWED